MVRFGFVGAIRDIINRVQKIRFRILILSPFSKPKRRQDEKGKGIKPSS